MAIFLDLDVIVMKNLLKKYKHGLLLIYVVFYMPCFTYLEKRNEVTFTAMNSPLDDLIPYVEVFIIPYLLWFVYIAVGGAFLMLKTQREFTKMMCTLMFGMTIFLIVSAVFPNELRDFRAPDASDSFLGKLVAILHSMDTPTNVFPSIHVYNSLCMHVGLISFAGYKHKWAKPASFILCVLICLSTMFLKQHAIIDVIGGTVLAVSAYKLVYKTKLNDFIDKHTWA